MAGSRPGRRVSRPVTRFLCRWVPQRKTRRTWTARAVARVYCHALSEGVPQPEIEAAVAERCLERVTEDVLVPREEKALGVAMDAIGEDVGLFRQSLNLFGIVSGVLTGLIFLFGAIRFAGPLRLIATPARTAARLAQIQVNDLVARIQLRVRADEQLLKLLQRTAAGQEGQLVRIR